MSNKHVLIMQAKHRRDKAICDAEPAAQEAIRAAVDAYDVAVMEIVEGMTRGTEVAEPLAPVSSAPQGHSRGDLQLRPEDLENDEIFRQILHGFKTYQTTYFRLQ